ncbi:Ca-activated chloride channel family protein [Pseudoxanthomonas sp. GM95]|uniref:VWA domain-containing protein n=1 Tax=Pseudoxanthomonas sp. GM95 TaxID=1881043 RepID=UPI0008D5E968|nr:VWA domain-containing protein [Pseudoxanthomonas sp. GM95]SEL70467.1 Ca-activated chloride channel family protein [Pseudoxanthomonas sp. GM95]
MNRGGWQWFITALKEFHFLRPWWLLALLALPLLWWLWKLNERRSNAWRGLVDAHLLAHLQVGGGRRQTLTLLGALLAWVIGAVALAGPTWRQEEQPLWQTRAPLVIALDLSDSINANDLPPSRLLQARAKVAALLRERAGGQVGLVTYAGEAFTVAPLTDDAANVALFLDALDPSIMPVAGSNARNAIALAQSLMHQAGFEQGQILLLTDHADENADSAARRALGAGFNVSVLGLGTRAGAAYRAANGEIGRAQLEPASLQRLASAGGGRYQPLSAGDADLKALGVLDPQSEDARAQRGEKGTAWRDQGYWLLPLLMLLCLFAFRRGGMLAAIALCVLLPMAQPAAAADWWTRADQKAQQRIEQGAQAYRKGDFAGAQVQFNGLSSADGLYNQGNALAKQGQYDQAIAAYDAALKQQPGMEDAIANRAAVEAARKQQPPPGGGGQGGEQGKNGQDAKQGGQQSQPQSGQSGDKSQDQNKDQQAPSKQDASKDPGKSGQDNANQDASKGKPQDGKPDETKSAAEQQQEQQAADAAQRQRMQQAMQQAMQQDGKPQDPAKAGQAQAAPETAAERERRQATEAWLRRVPDDPGGLLKAKFQLEYQRRQRDGE